MQRLVNRLLGSFAVHLVLTGLVVGLIILVAGDFSDASEELRSSITSLDPTLSEQTIRVALDETKQALMAWVIRSLVVSFVAAGVFLIIAERTQPANDTQARGKRWFWALPFLIVLVTAGILWWRLVSIPQLGANLAFGNLTGIVASGSLALLLAYYLGTALFVKITMKPAVPLAEVLPGMR